MKNKPWGGGLVALVLILWLFCQFKYWPELRKDGHKLEESLSKEMTNLGYNLSACLDDTNIRSQVDGQEYLSLRNFLLKSAYARWVVPSSDPKGSPTLVDDVDKMFRGAGFQQWLRHNYPSVNPATWDGVIKTLVGCRQQYGASIEAVRVDAKKLGDWIVSGHFYDGPARTNFPDGHLNFQIDPANPAAAVLTNGPALNNLTQVIDVPGAGLPQQRVFVPVAA